MMTQDHPRIAYGGRGSQRSRPEPLTIGDFAFPHWSGYVGQRHIHEPAPPVSANHGGAFYFRSRVLDGHNTGLASKHAARTIAPAANSFTVHQPQTTQLL